MQLLIIRSVHILVNVWPFEENMDILYVLQALEKSTDRAAGSTSTPINDLENTVESSEFVSATDMVKIVMFYSLNSNYNLLKWFFGHNRLNVFMFCEFLKKCKQLDIKNL